MDLGELLNFQPSRATKRPLEQFSPSPSPSHKQHKRTYKYPPTPAHSLGKPIAPSPSHRPTSSTLPVATQTIELPVVEEKGFKNRRKEEERLLQLLAAVDEVDDKLPAPLEEVTPAALKRMLLSLEKKCISNQQFRVKYSDEPSRFMDSELELYEEIQQLRLIATCPDFYPQLLELDYHSTLLQLLSHDNADISACVADLLREMLDVDPLNEGVEGASLLTQALLEGQVMTLLVSLLAKLDERNGEESQGVHNILGLVENMAEFKQVEVLNASGEHGLLIWLLKRIRSRAFDANKLYSTEILSILLQSNRGNQQLLGAKNGIDSLLEAVSLYKRKEPTTGDETEMVENLFDCICMSLTHAPNRTKFLEGEGLQLMILLLKDRKMCRRSALKVLNHALLGREGLPNCVKFVELYGLRTIFPFFMLPNKSCKKNAISGMEQDEHVISILLSLLQNVHGPLKDRVLAKFIEKDMEKAERLVELHFNYKHRSSISDTTIAREMEDDKEEALDEDMVYLRRLDGGLFVLQQIDLIMLEVICSGPSFIKDRIFKLLEQKRDSIASVKTVVSDFIDNMGDDISSESDPSRSNELGEKRRLIELLRTL